MGGAAAALASAALPVGAQTNPSGLDFPIEDYHVHLNTLTIDQVVAISKERGVKYGDPRALRHEGERVPHRSFE